MRRVRRLLSSWGRQCPEAGFARGGARPSRLLPVLVPVLVALFAASPVIAQGPSVPRNVSVTPGDNKLTINWQAPSSWGGTALGFLFEWKRSQDASSPWSPVLVNEIGHVSGPTDTSLDFVGRQLPKGTSTWHVVTPGTSYDLRIRAGSSDGTNNNLGSWVTVTNKVPTGSVVQFEHGAYTPEEGLTSRIRLRVKPAPTSSLTVALGHTPGTAMAATGSTCEAGADYVPPASTVTVAAGDTLSSLFSVRICQDQFVESDEKFTMTIGSGTGYIVGTLSSTTVTIVDGTLTVSLSASPNPVGEGSGVTVTATRSGPGPAATIPVTVTRGTSEAGDHGTITGIGMSAGATTGTATIWTNRDADADDETFTVKLGSSLPNGHAAVSPSSVEVMITDNGVLGTAVRLSASPNPVAEGYGVTVTAALSTALSSYVTIPLTLTAGTAAAGDYGALASITVAAGATSGTGTISTNRDADADDETFTVALGSLPASVVAGTPSSVTITISDDGNPNLLGVEAIPACGTTVTDMSVAASTVLVLTPPPAAEVGTEWRVLGANDQTWLGALNIGPSGRSFPGGYSTFAELRQAFPRLAGFEFRLRTDTVVRTQCTWQFDDGGGGTPTVPIPPPDDDDDGGGDPPPGNPDGGGGPPPDDDGGGGGSGGFGGGGDAPPPANRAPAVTLSCAPCEVERGGEAMLTASASDPDEDPLTYAWSASAGVIAGADDTARWTAPDAPGAVTIRVEVSDGEGGTASAEVTVDVLVVVPEQTRFDIPERGTAAASTGGEAESLRTGYGRIRPDSGGAAPSGFALFRFRDPEGVLITEAAVPAAAPIRRGRIFAEVGGAVVTAVAVANPNDRPSDIAFYVTDTAGTRIKEGSFTLDAQQHLAGLLNAAPFKVANGVVGTFTFTASAPLAVAALRGVTNEAGEWLATALPVGPVAELPSPFSATSTDPVVFPHFAAGQGWNTQVIMVNPTRIPIEGTLEFRGPDGAPLAVALAGGGMGLSFPYAIAAHGARRFTLATPAGQLASGSVRATPSAGPPLSATPSGLLLYSFSTGGKTVSVTGLPGQDASTAFRVPIAAAGMPGQPGSIRSGLAIANTTAEEARVSLEITRPDGSLVPPLGSLTLPPGGQTARLLDEIIDLPQDFSSGLLRVSATGEVAVVALRTRINRRGELKATSIPPQDEIAPATSEDRYFAHLADSGGWTTELILYSGTAGEVSSGTLSLFWFPTE